MERKPLILFGKDVNTGSIYADGSCTPSAGIDLDLYRGEVLAIVGESGSGKSVFTKSFMGLLDANGSITDGTIDYYGMPDGKPIRLPTSKPKRTGCASAAAKLPWSSRTP